MTYKIILILTLVLVGTLVVAFRGRFQKPTKPLASGPISFYELRVGGLNGGTLQMADFKGKYVLCVNVASNCGYTPQYTDLQTLSEKYRDKLVVIGFPCNQFMFQEPGSASDIAQFCERNYGVTFPLSEKIDVKGKDQHPIYQWLTQKKLNGTGDADVSWNFNKFLVSPKGEWLAHFGSKTEPLSTELTSLIK